MKAWHTELALAVVTVLTLAAFVTTAQASTSFTPVADTYVDAGSPTNNYGSRTYMRADATPTRTAFLRFDVQGVSDFSSATLRVYMETTTNVGFEVHSVTDNSWSESTVTYQTAPTVGAPLFSSGPVSGGTWVSVDLSGHVSANGLVSFALTTTDGTAIKFTTREGANKPELLIPAPATAQSYAISRSGSTYTASSDVGTSFSGTLKAVVEAAVTDLDMHGGGSVTFGTGTYDLGADYFKLEQIANITFAGQGIDATIIQNNSSASADTEPFNFGGAFGIVIRDLTVSAGGPARSTSDAIDFDQGNDSLVERVKITSSRARGIIFDGKNSGWTADRNTIRDCIITGNIPSRGIELLAANDNVVENCTISNTGSHGIQVAKSSSSADQPNKKSNGNIIRGNTIDNAGQDGINILSSDDNQILSNTITNSANITAGRDGIRLNESNSVTCDDNRVEGNVATDNQAVKTQSYGLNITTSLCNRTIVSANNFAGNAVGELRNLGTDTQIISTDTVDPSVPTNLTAPSVTYNSVTLAWDAATDNVGVTGYTVYRDGQQIATVSGATLTYLDAAVSASTDYSYTVDAFDAAGNHSDPSSPVMVTTLPQPATGTFNPSDDAYVKSDAPTSNYGTSTSLRADASPDVRSYLRFVVQGLTGSVVSAKLRIYASSSSSIGHDVRSVTETSWSESSITYADAPAIGAVIASSGPFSGGGYIEVDVTALITGNGTYTLAVTTPSNTAISYASDESANRPQLVLDLMP